MRASQADPQSGAHTKTGDQAGGLLKLGAVQVVDVVSSVVHELDRDGKRIQFVMERTPTVMADSERLAQATSSLLRSALSTSTKGPIEIEVAARCLAQEHQDAGATAADDGASNCEASVSVAIRDRSRSKPARRLNISDARRIVQLHSGRVWYTAPSEPGRTFGFCLGLQRAA